MKQIITILALLICLSAKAQSSHLPKEITIKLTDKETIALASVIDSCRIYLLNSNFPAGQINPFVNRLQMALSPFFKQVGAQMRVDTVKKPQPIKK